ncbi:MAG: UDP-N-acetylenolpyruvoylglucosamine reductase [Candidatus Lloydbacteria bacterium RIFCSPHIGHO2_02_FULL_50_13]|uniref:UDP-N-acetylenolpyruvoylglucosamine reductase n=1 Tax=Candidatus Lloydbacteria bacterium RIFCSPHIGHO2_02_FULL_50_13 TaxID=1798661 RepID=A0A1G2D6Q5_9BACT|nr:MAG: UDP-N-acetylenolpyruvoylglucosamine reductase [Candidatus Lloydbacteria bacterium RIFCSPHIGHO2_02_FULL_50_13]
MEVKEFILLAPHTTFKIGGLARYFCDVSSLADLKEALHFAREKHLPTFILGGGSNVLISDAGFPGVVLRIAIPGIEWESRGNHIFATAGAGVVWDEFVAQSVARGYWGIENLSGIPGSVGASVIQNIGAYGVEVSSAVERVEAYSTKEGMVRQIPDADCGFAYRDSIWKHEGGKGLIVTRICFRLKKNGTPNIAYKDLGASFGVKRKDAPALKEVREAVLSIRKGKLPDLVAEGTAGSFFKHPIVTNVEGEAFLKKYPDAPHFDTGQKGCMKLSAGWIIEHVLQMKGMRKGNVGVSEKQALVLLNYGGATEKEVRAFAREIQYAAAINTNIHLEPEVVFVE